MPFPITLISETLRQPLLAAESSSKFPNTFINPTLWDLVGVHMGLVIAKGLAPLSFRQQRGILSTRVKISPRWRSSKWHWWRFSKWQSVPNSN